MIKRNLLLVCLFLGISTSGVMAQNSLSVAMVADIEGEGAISQSQPHKTLGILDEMLLGAQIKIDPAVKLTLFYFSSSEEHVFTGPAEIIISADRPALISGTEIVTRNLGLQKLAKIAQKEEGALALGLLKLRNLNEPNLRLITPVNTKVISASPEFRWDPVTGAAEYSFILTDELGKAIVDISTTDTKTRLPKQIQLVADEEYTWAIVTRTSTQAEYRAHAYFSIADEALKNQVVAAQPKANARFSEKIVFARLLEQLGLQADAKVWWRELAQAKPDASLLKERAKK